MFLMTDGILAIHVADQLGVADKVECKMNLVRRQDQAALMRFWALVLRKESNHSLIFELRLFRFIGPRDSRWSLSRTRNTDPSVNAGQKG